MHRTEVNSHYVNNYILNIGGEKINKIVLVAIIIFAIPIILLVGSIALTMIVSSVSGPSMDTQVLNALCGGLQEQNCGSTDPDGESGELTAGNCIWNPVQEKCEGNP